MDADYFSMLREECDKERRNMGTANIMIVGKTGVGKSTLINNVFRECLATTGIGRPVTQHLTKLTKKGVPLTLYDSKGLELDAAVQRQIKAEIVSEIDAKLRDGAPQDFIHVVWYCINAASNRIEAFEIEWVTDFSQKLPVIVVLTQCQSPRHEELEKQIKALNLPVVDVVSTMAEEMRFAAEFALPQFGLDKLVDATLKCIPDAAQRALVNAQKACLEKKIQEASAAVNKYVAAAFAVGFTPIPFSDAAILVPGQLKLIARVASIFGVTLDAPSMIAIITAVGAVGGVALAGKALVANILKFVPGIGSAAGGLVSGSVAAMLTAALGFACIRVFSEMVERTSKGETVSADEVSELMKAAYAEHLRKDGAKIRG
ncbi:MAG: DUF697 domain-containing protein [Dethiobacter sp.]|nr:DUF697 domain-containing protein [Dethiobacter sp.]MBS4054918.1 DUF697 domain-containing protein [Thermaerobacter sp.]